jgi:hypothetical protein
MELRSGAVVDAAGVAAAAREALAAPTIVLAPPPGSQARAAFEEGARLLFQRWTALNLAVENQWAGPGTAATANWLLQEAINWCYNTKGEAGLGGVTAVHTQLPCAAACSKHAANA